MTQNHEVSEEKNNAAERRVRPAALPCGEKPFFREGGFQRVPQVQFPDALIPGEIEFPSRRFHADAEIPCGRRS